jgi:perosamine synthetase
MSEVAIENLVLGGTRSTCEEQSRIPVSAPSRAIDRHRDDIRMVIDRVLASGRLLGGSEVEGFEAEFADYLRAGNAIAVGSGTDALELALRACGVMPGDRVATVSLTAVATVAAIERSGARPVLLDVNPLTLSLDPAALACLCKRMHLKAVIAVHLYGFPADMPQIVEVAARHGVIVIEDCAQAHGAKLHGRRCGTFGEIAAFSFYPTKNLGGLGDGGAVVTNNAALADRVRLLREYGWRQRHFSEIAGVNSRLDALQAAVLRVKLRHLDGDNVRRAETARRYDEALRNTHLRLPTIPAGASPVYHQFVVRSSERKALREHLALNGIDTAIHYEHPVHMQPAYKSRNLTAGERLLHTELACREVVSLPVLAELTDHEVDRVARSLASFRDSQRVDMPAVALSNDSQQVLPVSRPSIGADELRAVAEVFESAWLGHGSTVMEFEKALREMFGERHVVAVSSGTSALHLALDALGLKAGDEVIVPSLTFCATAQAITAVGASPVFCEIEPNTLNIDITDMASRLTSRTRAIMPVHYCGNACDMDALLQFAAANELVVVEDAAHAFGSSCRGRLVGSFGDIACFSFDPIKNITCGEGGAVVLSDDELADLIRRKRLLGMHRDRWGRSNDCRPWWYRVDVQGYRYHMNNINAAIGLKQLGRLPWFRSRKQELVRRYNECFAALAHVELLRWKLDDCCPFNYILRVKHGLRDELRSFLTKRGIESSVHYIPNHLHPYFRKTRVSLPVTESVYDEIISLPLYVDMSDGDLDRVATAVTDCFHEK